MIRRKDFYVLFVLTALIVLIMGSVNFFGDDKIVRYLKEICLLLIWVSSLVMAITTAARQLPSERENRTIFPLLAKPVTRDQVVLGKFFGCWFAMGMALLLFYLFFAVISGSREHYLPVGSYLQALGAHWLALGVIVAMALLGSLVFAAPSSNGTICLVVVIGILTVGRHLNKVALGMPEPQQTLVYTLYYLLPHLELFDLRDLVIHNWPVAPWCPWLMLHLYAAVYAALFLLAACLKFRRTTLD